MPSRARAATGSTRTRGRDRSGPGRSFKLPDRLRSLFWDYDFATPTGEADQELMAGRVLASGTWEAVTWLRSQAGDEVLRQWIERRRGAGLSVPRLRFWVLILEFSHRQVNDWIAQEGRRTWDDRLRR